MREKKDVLYVVQGLVPIGGVTGKKTHPAELPQSAASRDELVSALAVGGGRWASTQVGFWLKVLQSNIRAVDLERELLGWFYVVDGGLVYFSSCTVIEPMFLIQMRLCLLKPIRI